MAPAIELKGTLSTTSSASALSSLRTRFSHRHIQCALICTKESIEIEKTYKEGSKWEENAPQHGEDQAYVSGAIITSVAYLEALINEFFNDCEHNSKNVTAIGENKIETLKGKWKSTRFRESAGLIKKYQTAYGIINGRGIDEKLQLFIDFSDLIKLRHKLVHYQSHFQSDDDSDPYELNHLQGRFNENVFMKNTGNPFFPYKCLGAGCAKWAIKTSIEFTDFFYSEINLKKILADHELLDGLYP